MGKRGPKPTPTAILNLRGSWRGKRRGPEVALPPPRNRQVPIWLRADRVASAEWRRVVPRLEAMGVLADLYRTTLAAYCQNWSDYRHALEEHEKLGRPLVYKDPAGNIKPNPILVEVNKAYARFRASASDFGLTPADQVSVRGGAMSPEGAAGGQMSEFDAFRARHPNLRLTRYPLPATPG